ncbi:hypothetical protein LCGC14_1589950 [marine sediment metagenome]|uniref:Uncharacterized protein n=1 Tax=marine sediment metagenome TaxID=412755 RepID=A0A0F9IEK2_9ZZZZ
MAWNLTILKISQTSSQVGARPATGFMGLTTRHNQTNSLPGDIPRSRVLALGRLFYERNSKMEHTKGKLQAIGSTKAKFKDAYFIRLEDTENSFIAKTYGHTGFPAEANAKELVRRWNAFEKDGLVDELRKTLTSTLCGEFPLLLGLARIEDAATGSSINTINVEGRIQEVEAAIAKVS